MERLGTALNRLESVLGAFWASRDCLGASWERFGSYWKLIGASWERLGSISVGLITGTQGSKRRSCSTKLVISGEGWRVNIYIDRPLDREIDR